MEVATVLLVEDEQAFVDALEVALRREGFVVRSASDGPTALELFEETKPDIVLLDVMLPGMTGIDVCRAIRARSSVPVIMVTARETELDMVVGLEVGADDYVAKPYRLRELVARMRAVLRRAPDRRQAERAQDDDVIEIDGIRLDVTRHEVYVRDRRVHLALKEFELLAALMQRAGRVVTREALLDSTWGSDYYGSTKTLDVHVKRLRTKIEDDPAAPTRITTIRGLGYRYELGVRAGRAMSVG